MEHAAPVVVRRAEVRDAQAIAATFATPHAMAGTLQLPYPSVPAWTKWIENARADDYILVAEIDANVVGNAGLHAASKSPRRRHAAGIGMSVHDDWQRRGVGSALLAAIVDLADNWIGYARLELTVYSDNAAAIALYRKFGFVIEGTLRNYALRDGDYVDAHAMARFAPVRPRRPAGTAATKDEESQ